MYDHPMFRAQAETISDLNDQIRQFRALEQEYREIKRYGVFYREMQAVIQRSSTLQNAWKHFLVQMKFVATPEEMRKLDPEGFGKD